MKVMVADFDDFEDFVEFLKEKHGDDSIMYYVASPAEQIYVLEKLNDLLNARYADDGSGSFWIDLNIDGNDVNIDGKIKLGATKYMKIPRPSDDDVIDKFEDKNDGSVWYLAKSDVPGIFITWSEVNNEVVTDPVLIYPFMSRIKFIEDINDLFKCIKETALLY